MINSLPRSIFSGENQINLVSNLSYLPFTGKYDPFLTVLVGYAQARCHAAAASFHSSSADAEGVVSGMAWHAVVQLDNS